MTAEDRPGQPASTPAVTRTPAIASASAVTPAPAALGDLRRFSDARIALGRSGAGLPTAAQLRFGLDHARARDAVHSTLDVPDLLAGLQARGLPAVALHSRAESRASYLRRPDLGRQVDLGDGSALAPLRLGGEVLLALADGLSASAVTLNALPLVDALLPLLQAAGLACAGAVVIEQGRVAAADAVAAHLQAGCTIVLIGERPGLSAADSLGAYLTWAAAPGTPDSRRNCVSNIRSGGLPPAAAARKIAWLATEMCRRRSSGIALKAAAALPPPAPGSAG